MADLRQNRVLWLIDEHKGRLVRQKKHRIYRFPTGLVFTTASTPSDARTWLNSLADLKRLLGVQPSRKNCFTVERQRRKRHAKTYPVRAAQKNKLIAAGVDASSLQSALEKAMIEQSDFEGLMLAQGVKKMAAV
jgi:hypothetical protein